MNEKNWLILLLRALWHAFLVTDNANQAEIVAVICLHLVAFPFEVSSFIEGLRVKWVSVAVLCRDGKSWISVHSIILKYSVSVTVDNEINLIGKGFDLCLGQDGKCGHKGGRAERVSHLVSISSNRS